MDHVPDNWTDSAGAVEIANIEAENHFSRWKEGVYLGATAAFLIPAAVAYWGGSLVWVVAAASGTMTLAICWTVIAIASRIMASASYLEQCCYHIQQVQERRDTGIH